MAATAFIGKFGEGLEDLEDTRLLVTSRFIKRSIWKVNCVLIFKSVWVYPWHSFLLVKNVSYAVRLVSQTGVQSVCFAGRVIVCVAGGL